MKDIRKILDRLDEKIKTIPPKDKNRGFYFMLSSLFKRGDVEKIWDAVVKEILKKDKNIFIDDVLDYLDGTDGRDLAEVLRAAGNDKINEMLREIPKVISNQLVKKISEARELDIDLVKGLIIKHGPKKVKDMVDVAFKEITRSGGKLGRKSRILEI